MRKHLYRTDEFFRIIDKYLEENHLKPTELDYSAPTSHPTAMRTYEWDVVGTVNFGGCEGIYLDIYAHGDVTGGQWEDVTLGTYKTLDTSKEAFKRMGDLNAEFVFAARDYVNKHMDDFEWTGYHVEFFQGGHKILGITCQTEEYAVERAKRGGKQYECDTVKITDNRTSKVQMLNIKQKIAE